MSAEAWIAVGAVCVFVGGAFVYAMFMVFLPEWVGIAGKAAKEAERSHQGGEEEARGWLDRMQDRPRSARAASSAPRRSRLAEEEEPQ